MMLQASTTLIWLVPFDNPPSIFRGVENNASAVRARIGKLSHDPPISEINSRLMRGYGFTSAYLSR